MVQAFEGFLREEVPRGFTPPLRADDLAYLIVRIVESFIYADMITGDEPDPGKVEAAIAALLQVHLP